VRLELCFGASAESWLAHQAAYDLWQMEARRGELRVEPLITKAAWGAFNFPYPTW
jgi:plasmid maintenance system antidote protein VapI